MSTEIVRVSLSGKHTDSDGSIKCSSLHVVVRDLLSTKKCLLCSTSVYYLQGQGTGKRITKLRLSYTVGLRGMSKLQRLV